MVTDGPSQSRWPGAARNFTAAIAASRISVIVQKIAMPPPSGITVWWYLSLAGWATKPVLRDSDLTAAVSRAERMKEPASKITANMVNVSILAAPYDCVAFYTFCRTKSRRYAGFAAEGTGKGKSKKARESALFLKLTTGHQGIRISGRGEQGIKLSGHYLSMAPSVMWVRCFFYSKINIAIDG